jgi:hypothetical protein
MRLGTRTSLVVMSLMGVGLGLANRAVGAASVSILPAVQLSSTNVNLSAQGTSDWIRWEGNTNLSTSPSQFDHDVVGGSKISTWTALPGSGTDSIDPDPADNNNVTFSWTNGSPNISGSNTLGYIWGDSNGQDSTNTGFSFTVAADTNTYDLRLYAINYITTAKLVATLTSPSSTVLATQTDTSWTNSTVTTTPTIQSGYYDIIFTGAEAGDTLSVTYSVGTNFGFSTGASGEGDVGISAAALSVVPEPSVLALCFAGLLPLTMRRRS